MVTCTECGEQNPVGTEFCLYCHAFLAWDAATAAAPPVRPTVPAPAPTPVRPPADHPLTEAAVETRMMPRIPADPASAGSPVTAPLPVAEPSAPDPDPVPEHGLFRLTADETQISVPATGAAVSYGFRIANTSGIVDGYAVETPGAPDWLVTEAAQLSLLPGQDDQLAVRLRVVSTGMVPAQQLQVLLRVVSLSQAPAHTDLPVTITIPVVDAPVRLRAEPRLLKIRDATTADFTVYVDNAASNRAARLSFSGSDPELAVEFRFEPPVLEVPPGGQGSVQVGARAPGPEAGQEISRALTVAAVDGARSVETLITLQQATSIEVEDPMVSLEVVPSVIRVRDRADAMVQVVVDNSQGRQWAHIRLDAADPERAVRVGWEQPMLHVPPGRTAQTQVRFEAQPPEAGAEASRVITIGAGDGRRRATTTATFVQTASNSPMATLALRLEPSVLKVRDADGAHGQVLVDNRRGARSLRVQLQGSDPEGTMRFAFQQPVVDVPAGQTATVGVRVDAWRPPPGEQLSRPFSIAAGDGQNSVETSGTLNQISSRDPMELLALRLDPSVLQLGTSRRGQLAAVLDNRAGTQPVRVSLRGDDPMNLVGFSFNPGAIDVPPGAVTTAVVTVEAPRAPTGQEVTRPFVVVATDGRSETKPAEGSMVQATPVRVSYARQIWRVLLTLLGGLLIIFGTLQPFSVGGSEEAASEFDANEVSQTFNGPDLLQFNPPFLPTVGLVIIVLAVIMMFGLTGPKGRLTRITAFSTAALVVGFSIALIIFQASTMLGLGALIILIGCVIGYVGGLLVKR